MASPAPTEPVALKVFGIPELAHLICDITRKHDHANLMQVCRGLFYSILPFVWEEVDRPDILASMIPGGDIVSYESEMSPYVVMQLPCSLDLLRFKIYAPYVKRLTLSFVDVDAYDNWDKFLACTRSVDLLPNLETIYFPSPNITKSIAKSGKVETDSVNWAIAFLSTSLRNLVQAPLKATYPIQEAALLWMDMDSFNRLMTSIAQKCPQLYTLSVLPGQVSSRGVPDHDVHGSIPRIVFACDSPEIYSSFLQLGSLTTLLISTAILCPEGLAALSGLPRLESLCVVGWKRDLNVYGEDLQLPTDAFPALRHLELNRLTWVTVLILCNTKSLVTRLQSLTITCPIDSRDIQSYGETFTDLSGIIPLLASHNSSITTLTVHDHGSQRLSHKTLDAWRHLPLVSLHLEWVIIGGCGFDVLCAILACLPLLERLQLTMAQERFELEQLRMIVELLPRLRCIEIPVRWWRVAQLTAANFTPCQSQSTSVLRIKSEFHLAEPQDEGASQIARFLSILRPTASVVCASPQLRQCDPSGYPYEDSKDMINAELSRLWLE